MIYVHVVADFQLNPVLQKVGVWNWLDNNTSQQNFHFRRALSYFLCIVSGLRVINIIRLLQESPGIYIETWYP